MALCSRHFLVDAATAAPVVAAYQELERKFVARVADLARGHSDFGTVTMSNFADFNQAAINDFNQDVDDLFEDFVTQNGIAAGLDARDHERPTFDNFFKWAVDCTVRGTRLLISVRAASKEDMPFDTTPEMLREITQEQFDVFCGANLNKENA